MDRRTFFKTTGVSLAAVSSVGSLAWINPPPARAAAHTDQALHLLNRVTWGATPEDRAKIAELGIEQYLDWQLDADQIPDPLIDVLLEESPLLTQPYIAVVKAAQDDYSIVIRTKMWERLYRAVMSERQLYEVMVEFWTDHFNIPIADLLSEKLIDDRDVIRAHALGKFRDLLLGSASSPAMLYYLNQDGSDKDYPNENYAREVMELHTLGVDGGYTEADVKALARILTGWTANNADNTFTFDRNAHDDGEKTFLGRTFPAGRGVEEGLEALDLLSVHPATARFIATKLIRRFVQDQPPSALIDTAAQVFIDNGGEIKPVLRHILLSKTFQASAGQKFRRPYEFYVAILRALRSGLETSINDELIYVPYELGQVPFGWHPPNGYPDVAAAWLNANMLLNRWNFAATFPLLNGGWYGDKTRMNWEKFIARADAPTARAILNRAADLILAGRLEDDQHAIILEACGYDGLDPDAPIATDQDGENYENRLTMIVGLLLASPAFQWK